MRHVRRIQLATYSIASKIALELGPSPGRRVRASPETRPRGPGKRLGQQVGRYLRRVAVAVSVSACISPLDVGGEGRRQVGVGGVRWLRATHIANLPFFHMVAIGAAPERNGHGMERRECVRIRRSCPRPLPHVSVESGPQGSFVTSSHWSQIAPKMEIDGTGRALDRSQTGRE